MDVTRRGFLGLGVKMIGGVAAGAAVRQWPFRVYSFASTPTIIPFDAVLIQETFRILFDPTPLYRVLRKEIEIPPEYLTSSSWQLAIAKKVRASVR